MQEISSGSSAGYIQSTYKRQDSRENTSFKGSILGAYYQGLPGEEVRFGDGAFQRDRSVESRSSALYSTVMFGKRGPYRQ